MLNTPKAIRDASATPWRGLHSSFRVVRWIGFLPAVPGDAELEWLVCLASTFQASQRQAPNVSDETVPHHRRV